MTYEDRILNFKRDILGFNAIDQSTCCLLTNELKQLEDKILNLGLPNYPQAPSDTITTRHEYYNLLDLLSNQSSILTQKIVETSKQIIGGDEFYIKMWANIFRKGQRIQRHMHHASPIIENEMFKKNIFKTICGNLFLYGDQPSDTIYYGKETITISNNPGDIYFFSCIMEHETLPYQGDQRIGIAFDVYTKNFFPDLGMSTPPNLRLIS